MLSLISGAQFTNWIKRDTWTIDPSQQPVPLFLLKNNLRRFLEKTDNFNEHFFKLSHVSLWEFTEHHLLSHSSFVVLNFMFLNNSFYT